jgi:nitric oxide reductase large subunit
VLRLTLSLVPVGIAQLTTVVQDGYLAARSVAFYDTVTAWLRLRLIGDVAFLAAGGLLLVDVVRKLRRTRPISAPGTEPAPPALVGGR